MSLPSEGLLNVKIAKASFREVIEWQQRILDHAIEDDNNGLETSGPTAASIATTLIDLLGYNSPRNEEVASFQPAPGVRCRMHGLVDFFQKFHSIEM